MVDVVSTKEFEAKLRESQREAIESFKTFLMGDFLVALDQRIDQKVMSLLEKADWNIKFNRH